MDQLPDVRQRNPTDRLSVRDMAEEKGYEGYLRFTFLANQGRSYTVIEAARLRAQADIDASSGG